MTASRASRVVAGLAFLGAALSAASLAHAVQLAQGAPIQLIPIRPQYEPAPQAKPAEAGPKPGQPPQSLSAPAPGFGASPAPVQTTPLAGGTPAQAAPKGIEVDTLGGIDPDALGALDPAQGGLGLDLWRGTSRDTVARLMAALPAGIASPALRELAHRLLLSTANAPEGPPLAGSGLISLRVSKLAEMGDLTGFKALNDVIPARFVDETLSRERVDADLTKGDTNAACNAVGSLLKQYPGTYWQKLQLFCLALQHKAQQVDIAVNLLHEEGEGKDAAFFTLIDAIMGNRSAKVSSLQEVTPLTVAMLRAAKQTPPEDVLRTARPDALLAIAASASWSGDFRLAAAERAAATGALSGEALRQVYDKVAVSDAEIANALTKAQSEYGPKARVLLYRAAKAQQVPTAKAEALRVAFSLARAAGVYETALAANLPFVESLTPSPELGFFAIEAGRALFYAGRTDAAQNWVALARQESAAKAQPVDASVALWPYTRLAASAAGAWDDGAFAAWRMMEKTSGPADATLSASRAVRLLGLFGAFGTPVAPAAWQGLLGRTDGERATMPSLAVWQGLKNAAAQGRRGETVLLALIAVGGVGPGSANPIALNEVIDSLRKVGLEPEAHRLAIESAVASGI